MKLTLKLCGVLVFAIVVFIGCNPADIIPTDQPRTSDTMVSDAITALKNKDYDTALSDFTKAYTADPTNGTAVVGYSLLNLADVVADPALVATLKNKVGLIGYPSTINDAIDPNKWLVQTISDWTTDTTDPLNPVTTINATTLFPQISGETDQNASGFIDITDRTYALGKFVLTHNGGFDFIPQAVEDTLGARLDSVVEFIETSATDDMKFTITWDMVNNTQPTEASGSWPYKDGQPMGIVLGKAELLALAASLEELRSFVYLTQVYSLALPLSEYWAYLSGGTASFPTTKPFETFLQVVDTTSQAKLNSAKASMTGALTDAVSSIDSILTNRAGFGISDDATTGIYTSTEFQNLSSGLTGMKTGLQAVQTSLTSSTMAYFPINNFQIGDPWPTSTVPGESVGLNVGAMFSSPLALVGTSGLIELSSTGEPQFYKPATGQFAALTSSDDTFFPAGADFTNDTQFAYMKITDATFGGAIDLASYPIDSFANQNVSIQDLYYDDADNDYHWDAGETITGATLSRNISGLILQSTLDADNETIDDYIAAMKEPSSAISLLNSNPDSATSRIDTSTTTVSALVDALMSFSVSSPANFRINVNGPIFVLDDVNGNQSAVYSGAPRFIAWLSLAPASTTGTDQSGNPITSQGSLYWYGLSLASGGF